jgi:hypothetical protein
MKPTLILAALLLAPLVVLTAADAPAKKPNVIIILVDDMGYRGPQCFNAQSKITTSDIRTAA